MQTNIGVPPQLRYQSLGSPHDCTAVMPHCCVQLLSIYRCRIADCSHASFIHPCYDICDCNLAVSNGLNNLGLGCQTGLNLACDLLTYWSRGHNICDLHLPVRLRLSLTHTDMNKTSQSRRLDYDQSYIRPSYRTLHDGKALLPHREQPVLCAISW